MKWNENEWDDMSRWRNNCQLPIVQQNSPYLTYALFTSIKWIEESLPIVKISIIIFAITTLRTTGVLGSGWVCACWRLTFTTLTTDSLVLKSKWYFEIIIERCYYVYSYQLHDNTSLSDWLSPRNIVLICCQWLSPNHRRNI